MLYLYNIAYILYILLCIYIYHCQEYLFSTISNQKGAPLFPFRCLPAKRPEVWPSASASTRASQRSHYRALCDIWPSGIASTNVLVGTGVRGGLDRSYGDWIPEVRIEDVILGDFYTPCSILWLCQIFWSSISDALKCHGGDHSK